MTQEREHDRVPCGVEVRFRTASSFLFAYSVNLSKGGIFVETEKQSPLGTPITLTISIADAGAYDVRGHVTWLREQADEEGPAGMGIEFEGIDEALGEVIDELVTSFEGLTVLVFCPDSKDRASIARMVRSIIGTADVVEAGGTSTVEALMGDEIDLVVLAADAPEGAGWRVLASAKNHHEKIPVIALCSDQSSRTRATELGADEVANHLPTFADFQELLLRALGRPSTVT